MCTLAPVEIISFRPAVSVEFSAVRAALGYHLHMYAIAVVETRMQNNSWTEV